MAWALVDSLSDIIDAEKSMVTVSGDFSFTSKVFFAQSDECSGGDVANDLHARGPDNAKTSETMLAPQKLSEATGYYICLMVNGQTVIPLTSRYYVKVDYELPDVDDANTRAFPPSGKSRRLAKVKQNGIKITIPYLTTASQYNQRIVVANLSGVAVDYSMSFYPEAGTEAEAGANAMGTFGEGTTVLSVARDDVVTISGDRTRTAARLVIEADVEEEISVVTTQVNTETGSTDTVRYR